MITQWIMDYTYLSITSPTVVESDKNNGIAEIRN